MKILAVDDDPFIRDLLELALCQTGHRTLEYAPSGAAALELISEAYEPFSCFLLDINLPDIDGVELCKYIREMPSYEDTPIIMVSRLDHRLHLERAIIGGATDYVVKPIDRQDVITRIELAECRRLINEKRRLKSNPRLEQKTSNAPTLLKETDIPVFA
ncbi:PleD family two-component system response regulator [Roseivivax sp. THAF40]|uniref:response regulator n=1 Tax=Roseivivax sp. THAF40 TaxID=2587858 RepID=UPI0012684B27|nr:response regulator [Roseivivax sp. THAF40]